MLQKILAMLASLIITVTSLVAPAILPNLSTQAVAPAGPVEDLAVATQFVGNGSAAAASVLWTSVDGTRVAEDHWGLGRLDQLSFEVGLGNPGNVTLRVGQNLITLHPTDVLTIQGFDGRFAFSGVGTADATIQLNGTVRSTSIVNNAAQHVTTEGSSLRPSPSSGDSGATVPVGGDGSIGLAYVVLTNGVQQNTVSYTPGSGNRVSTEARHGSATEPTDLLVSSVTVNGAPVTTYFHGVGDIANLSFRLASTGQGDLVNVSGIAHPVAVGTLVHVAGFVGSYLVFQVQNGESRLRLDGYANQVRIDGSRAALAPGSDQPPRASFSFTPQSPKTADAVSFTDHSWDPDGQVILYAWTFGDGSSSNAQNPQHQYTAPGTYNVTLTVTDDATLTNETHATIVVTNTPPVADFDVTPAAPTDEGVAKFVSRSWDPDGSIAATHWAFGDGSTSDLADPTHAFADEGNYSVILTVTDDHGATDAITRVVPVTNVAPSPDFTWSPASPASRSTVTLQDGSADGDGHVVNWTWAVSGVGARYGCMTRVTFSHPGNHTVALLVRDDDGATSSLTRTIQVRNLPPSAAFNWTPQAPVTDQAVAFHDGSLDPDGSIVSYRWSFGDGNTSVATDPLHRYARQGTYHVNLTVTDDFGASAMAHGIVTVGDAPPQVAFSWSPTRILTNDTVTFHDLSSDPDGAGTIASRSWHLGDGHTATGTTVTETYPTNGVYAVRLTVTDDQGRSATLVRNVTVLDRPPVVRYTVDPGAPVSNRPMNLTVNAQDPDGVVASTWWILPNGTRVGGATTLTLPIGLYHFTAGARDNDGSVSLRNITIYVSPRGPDAGFQSDPAVPQVGTATTFHDTSVPGDSAITSWSWALGDGTTSSEENPVHTYGQPGNVTVTLKVQDGRGLRDTIQRTYYVDVPPVAEFSLSPVTPRTSDAVTFRSLSSDSDGVLVRTTWNLGDGTIVTCGTSGNCTGAQPGATVTHVVHAYSHWGTYAVTLTVTDDRGVSRNVTHQLSVLDRPPVASFDASPSAPQQGASVSFQDTSTDPDGPITAYAWNFGDGNGSTAVDPSHAYTQSGTFHVTHTVTDDAGAKSSATTNVRVGSTHALVIIVHVVVPGGTPVPLTGAFRLTFADRATGVANSTSGGSTGARGVTVLPNGTARVVLGPGEWAGGDRLQITAVSPSGYRRVEQLTPRSGVHSIESVLVLAPALDLQVTLTSGAPILPVVPTGSPTYQEDPAAPVEGRVNLTWDLGPNLHLPAPGVPVTLSVVYLVGPGGDVRHAAQTLTRQQVTTGPNGSTTFAMTPPLAGTAFAPGWYDLDVFAAPALGPAAVGAVPFVEDPTGVLTTTGAGGP